MTREEFIAELLDGLTQPPGYFPKNVLMNIKGYESIDEVMERGLKALNPREFEAAMEQQDTLVIDTRNQQEFAKGFIPGSYFFGIDGSFAVWVGTLVSDIEQKILLVGDEDKIPEAVTRLARVGYDHAIGYLKGGIGAWKEAGKELDSIESVSPDEFAKREAADASIKIADVRKKSEYDSEHIVNATNAPLDYIEDSMTKLDKDDTYYVHCAGGYRSMIFTSILRAKGYKNLIDVDGGFGAIKESGKFEVTDYVCPTTLL
jgi:rhodanese-related sulfurtransferase